MALPPSEWDDRFRQQAAWTEPLRRHLLSRLNLEPGARVLEVGCGTGVITASLSASGPSNPDYTQIKRFGLDRSREFLLLARQNDPGTRFTAGDALRLPFAAGSFAAVVCHFFLLWILQPAAALAEMVRVAGPGGAVIAFAEPDYGGRIDYPASLAELGHLQAEALRRQGADPEMGRKLSGIFHAAGLTQVETGLLGGQWQGSPTPAQLASEWATLRSDLTGMLPAGRLDQLEETDRAAWRHGERVLFVPTFYAVGMKHG